MIIGKTLIIRLLAQIQFIIPIKYLLPRDSLSMFPVYHLQKGKRI